MSENIENCSLPTNFLGDSNVKSSLFLKPTNENEKRILISKLKKKFSPGPGGLTSELIKAIYEYITRHILSTYRHLRIILLKEISKQDVINGTKNYTCSQRYMERIVKVSLVNILFQRLPIPENIFATKEFNSIPYRTIKMECVGTGIAQLYRKWIKGFKDAFRKKYVKEFILFFTDNSQSIQENFKFKFQYEGRIDKDKACTDLTKPTESLLKNLIALGEMPKLHKNIQMHVELFYYQGTPDDYIPPLFDSKDYLSTLSSKMNEEYYEASTLARTSTGFHHFVFSFKKKSNESQFLQDTQRELLVKKNRKRKSSDFVKKADNTDVCASEMREGKRRQWNISDGELMQTLTSIDLMSGGQSRVGISFDMDFAEIPNEEDIDIIAEDILSLSN